MNKFYIMYAKDEYNNIYYLGTYSLILGFITRKLDYFFYSHLREFKNCLIYLEKVDIWELYKFYKYNY